MIPIHPNAAPDSRRGPGVLLFVREANGLGQLSRAVTLAHGLRRRWPQVLVLVVSGSAAPHLFRFPEWMDYVKLPSVQRLTADGFVPRALPLPMDQVWQLRGDLLLALVRRYQPDLLVVDNFPADREILPALRWLKETRAPTRRVLGLRDVVGEPEVVRAEWARAGVGRAIEQLYDLVLVYGDREWCDVVATYGLSPAVAAKLRYTGYLRRDVPAAAVAAAGAGWPSRARHRVLGTVGGGFDGLPLASALLEAALAAGPDPAYDLLLVTGPFMPAADRQALAARIPPGRAVRVVEFLPDLAAHVAVADAVVAMGGHNTASEILTFQRRALLVPREGTTREQRIRAETLARRGLVRLVYPEHLTAARLGAELRSLLASPPPPGPALPDGVEVAVDALASLWPAPAP